MLRAQLHTRIAILCVQMQIARTLLMPPHPHTPLNRPHAGREMRSRTHQRNNARNGAACGAERIPRAQHPHNEAARLVCHINRMQARLPGGCGGGRVGSQAFRACTGVFNIQSTAYARPVPYVNCIAFERNGVLVRSRPVLLCIFSVIFPSIYIIMYTCTAIYQLQSTRQSCQPSTSV